VVKVKLPWSSVIPMAIGPFSGWNWTLAPLMGVPFKVTLPVTLAMVGPPPPQPVVAIKPKEATTKQQSNCLRFTVHSIFEVGTYDTWDKLVFEQRL
jgi:hypothetical protein